MFAGAGWSRVGSTTRGTAVTIKEEARRAKNAGDRSTARGEGSTEAPEARKATRRDEGTRRYEPARSCE
jgi:hypothetical protein